MNTQFCIVAPAKRDPFPRLSTETAVFVATVPSLTDVCELVNTFLVMDKSTSLKSTADNKLGESGSLEAVAETALYFDVI